MLPAQPVKTPVLIPFVCPVCAGSNAVELIALSRAGGVECVACSKWLRSADVMRAIHAPRSAPAEDRRVRAPPPKRAAMVWPPTPDSRRAIAPLKPGKGGGS